MQFGRVEDDSSADRIGIGERRKRFGDPRVAGERVGIGRRNDSARRDAFDARGAQIHRGTARRADVTMPFR